MSRIVLVDDWDLSRTGHEGKLFLEHSAWSTFSMLHPVSECIKELSIRRNYLIDKKLVYEVLTLASVNIVGSNSIRIENGDTQVKVDIGFSYAKIPLSYIRIIGSEDEQRATQTTSIDTACLPRKEHIMINPMFIVTMWGDNERS
jgi:hypothetical protein